MAAKLSKSRAAIVIATEATVSSHAYRDALQRHGVAAHEKACPLFVPLVEEGWIEHPVTEQVARIYLAEALAQAPEQADVLVLACTHYPLIAPLLRRIVPEHIQIVDSAESTARVVKKIIEEDVICHPERSEGASATERSRRTPIDARISPAEHRTFRFYATDSTDKFKRLATRFLGRQVDHVEHVDLGG
jgi:glutamate racemase